MLKMFYNIKGLIVIYIAQVVLAIGLIHINDEFFLRLNGVVLQCIGISLALWVLKKLRESLSQMTISDEAILSFRKLFNLKKNEVGKLEGSIFSTTTTEATLSSRSNDNVSPSQEERIIKIEKNFTALKAQNIELVKVVGKLTKDYNELIELFDETKKELNQKINIELINIHLGDWSYSIMSLVFILSGTIISSLSEEIICLF